MRKFTSQEIKAFVSKPSFDENIILNKDLFFPKITIVTPSYNQAEFLERTILSVLNQNYQNLEYIIIDGGSTDGSVDIIKKYAKYLTYWKSEKDDGQADAINKGFKKATGDLVGWQNSDDVYLPGSFKKAAEKFKENPNYEVYFGSVVVIDADEKILDTLRLFPFRMLFHIFEGIQVYNQAAFFGKDVFDKVGYLGIKYTFSFDYEFFCRLGKNKAKFFHINQFFGGTRHQKKSKTATISYIGRKEHDAIKNKYIPGFMPKPLRIFTGFFYWLRRISSKFGN